MNYKKCVCANFLVWNNIDYIMAFLLLTTKSVRELFGVKQYWLHYGIFCCWRWSGCEAGRPILSGVS